MNRPTLRNIKDNLYLIIPIICIGLWALFALIHEGIILKRYNENYFNDLTGYYNAGKRIFTKPQDLYKEKIIIYYLY